MCEACPTGYDDPRHAPEALDFDAELAFQEDEGHPWCCGTCGSQDPYSVGSILYDGGDAFQGPSYDPCPECLEAEPFRQLLQA